MHVRSKVHPFPLRCAIALALSMTGAGAFAAKPSSDVQARYEQERARCMAGQSGQAQDTCLREAVNARDAAMKGQLDDGGGKRERDQNARERCEVLTGADQRDCLARTRGNGNSMSGVAVSTPQGSAAVTKTNSTSGSVQGGGVLRETVTREVVIGAPVPASAASR